MRVEIFKLRERVWRKKKERHKGNGVEKKGKRTQKVKRMEEWKAAKKVLGYLHETKDHILTYRRYDTLR